ncbi:MAG TPA: serine protease, partial [Spirochaetia bacterium]|nr:serine protease [Spirochaetia bacterium]
MSLRDKLSSKNFFLVNLVLLGILIGFSAAFVSLTASARARAPAVVYAEGPGSGTVAEDAALASAESLQTAFNRVAESVLTSVVELDVVETVTSQAPSPDQFPWRFFFGPQEDGQNPQ